MGQPERCAALLKEGLSPAAIAGELGISTKTVIDYLFRAYGQEKILLSDIAFSVPRKTRDAIEEIISDLDTTSPGPIDIESRARGFQWNKDQFRLYLRLRERLLGDLYYFIADLEQTLHRVIHFVLTREYAGDSDEWWNKGVPESIRNACIRYRGSDPEPAEHPYSYTQFSHLRKIMSDHWYIFSKYLPPDAIRDKTTLMSDLQRACIVRNRLMHPVRRATFLEEDFTLMRDLRSRIEEEDWDSFPSSDAA